VTSAPHPPLQQGGKEEGVGPVRGRRGAVGPGDDTQSQTLTSTSPCPLCPGHPCGVSTPFPATPVAWSLHLGHTLHLVVHLEEQWEQDPLYFLLHLFLVSPHHNLHHIFEEADGELPHLAALLVGRRTGGLQPQLLPAHGEQGCRRG